MVSAVQKSYRKNILREMKGNASRMVSLFGIVALGVMMLTGLMSIAPSMRSAAQKYYVQQNVFDLRVLSTLGLSDQDIAAIAATPGVEAVMPVKTLDLEANWQGQEERMVCSCRPCSRTRSGHRRQHEPSGAALRPDAPGRQRVRGPCNGLPGRDR